MRRAAVRVLSGCAGLLCGGCVRGCECLLSDGGDVPWHALLHAACGDDKVCNGSSCDRVHDQACGLGK